jgi:hypothetical protein
MTDKSLICEFCRVRPQGDDKRVIVNGKAYCPHHQPNRTGKPLLSVAQLVNLGEKKATAI